MTRKFENSKLGSTITREYIKTYTCDYFTKEGEAEHMTNLVISFIKRVYEKVPFELSAKTPKAIVISSIYYIDNYLVPRPATQMDLYRRYSVSPVTIRQHVKLFQKSGIDPLSTKGTIF